jgi:chorismate mutase
MPRKLQMDPELAKIDALERAIVQAHDERIHLGATAEEIEQQRAGVAALATNICHQLREEYRARNRS